jgi:hypothetical protein
VNITGTYTDEKTGKSYTATAKVTVTTSVTGGVTRSSGTGEAKDGDKVVKSGKVKDFMRRNEDTGAYDWVIVFTDGDQKLGARSEGAADPLGGGSFQGRFTQATAVPEPATWLLMLAGLGGLGAQLRSRRKLIPKAA